MNSDWTTVINKRDKQKENKVNKNATVSNATVSEDTNPLSYRNMLLKNRYAIPKKETVTEKEISRGL